MSKREEQRIAKLIKKNAAKTSGQKQDRSAQYDDTLRKKPPETEEETRRFFKEMKRREFSSVELERLFAHLSWADERALAALRAAHPLPAKAHELYAHVLGAEHVWLARLKQVPATEAVWPSLDLPALSELAQANHAEFARLLTTLDDAALDREVPYRNSAGLAFRSAPRDILIHVALHGCYHRGQVALVLRGAGTEPLPTDYIAFVRGAPAATRTG